MRPLKEFLAEIECSHEPKHAKGLCHGCYNKGAMRWKRQGKRAARPAARKPDCHPLREHAARGLCRPCERTLGKQKAKGVWLDAAAAGAVSCSHPDTYALGLCKSCYNLARIIATPKRAARPRSSG